MICLFTSQPCFPCPPSSNKGFSVDDICVLFVKMKKIYQPPLGKIGLEALLKCEVLQYVKVHDIPHTAYKIKIHSKQLKRVLTILGRGASMLTPGS